MSKIPGVRRLFRLERTTDIDQELQFHIDAGTDDLVRLGMQRDQARREANRAFGDIRRYHDETFTIDREFAREVRMKEFLASVGSDLGYAFRQLRRSPGFSLVATLTLTLGIGATVAVFSAVSGVILRPLPFAHARQIVHVGEREVAQAGRGTQTSAENAYDWTRMNRSFQALGLFSTFSMTLTGVGTPARIDVTNVTPGIFDVFHVAPALGRRIIATDTMQGASNVALVSYDFWQAGLGADRNIVGRELQLNFNRFEIVGVLPQGFHGPGDLDRPLWANFVYDSSDGRGGRSKVVYALLKPGISVRQAQLDMTNIATQLAATHPRYNRDRTAIVTGLDDVVFGEMKRPLYLLLGASALVLLIACANISNLLVARGIAREREVAMRAALGAGRARITRQMLTESFLLAVIGSIAGTGLAYATMHSLTSLGPSVFQLRPPSLDGRVLAFTLAVSFASTVLFGLLPAMRMSRGGLYDRLRASARVIGRGGARTRSALALAQLALAVVLLSASALVIKSFARVLRVEPGVRVDNMLYADVWVPRLRYDSLKSVAFYSELERRLEATPGVRAVAMTSQVPFSGYLDRVSVSRFGDRPEVTGGEAPEGDRYVVTPAYFQTMGVKLLKGRLLSPEDRYTTTPVTVIDELFAKRAFGDADPIGQTMRLPVRQEFATVVGVVSHVKTYGLDVTSPGQIYTSNAQYPWRWLSVVVHTTGDAQLFAPTLARVVQSVDPDEPISNVSTIEKSLANLLKARRFALTLLGAFAIVAIVLAAIGLYGVIAYGVTQRRRELGVRVALGAQGNDIARMIVAEGARIAIFGASLGGLGAIVLGRLLASLLFEVNPRDPMVLSTVAAGLVIVAILACLIRARRAMNVDAAEILRGD